MLDSLRLDLDNANLSMRQFRKRHMKVAIRAKLLHWLMNTYFEYCFREHGKQSRMLEKIEKELIEKKAEFSDALETK